MERAMAPYEHAHRSVGGAQQLRDSLAGELDLLHEDAQAVAKRHSWDPKYRVEVYSDGDEGYGYDSYTSEALPTSTISHMEVAATAMPSSRVTFQSTSISSSSSAIPSKTLSVSKSIVPVSNIAKGLYNDDSYQSSTMPPIQASTSESIPSQTPSSSAKAVGDAATSTAAAPLITSSDAPNHSSLSSPAHNVLVASAVIGGLVFIGTVIYFILRFMNVDVKSYIFKFTRRKRGSWRPGPYGGLGSDTPPYATFPGEKRLPLVRKLHTPIIIPSASTAPAPSAQELARADTKRQDLVRQALREDPQPFLADADPFQDGPPAYELSTPHPPRRPSTAYGPDRRTSYLSSLSSGFGDLKIDIPESGPTKPQNALRKQSITDRISRNNFQSRFSHSSWISNPPTPARSRANSRSNRDTVYTAVSEESAPRFRTVNSWVSQQVRRAQRQQDVDREIDNMPEIPSQGVLAGNGLSHQRQPSEATESIFGFHPGEQVPIAKGKRVSSKILDRIL